MYRVVGIVRRAIPAGKRRWILVLAITLTGSAVLLATVVMQYEPAPVGIPKHVTAALRHPVYVPHNLPGNFSWRADSFKIGENNVLSFQARENTGATITFTEQQRPKSINFTEFYQQSIRDGKVLDDAPYPTLIGKTFDSKTHLLSIVTEETWIFATTRAPLTESQFLEMASSLYRYK